MIIWVMIIWVTLLSYLVWSELPDLLSVTGIAIIISSGIYSFATGKRERARTDCAHRVESTVNTARSVVAFIQQAV